VGAAHRPILPLMLYSQRLHRGTPNDREALDAAHAAPLRAGWGASMSCRRMSCLPPVDLDTAV
jgi:hypothetical protein